MNERIRNLMEQRNAALSKARAILDAAEGRALTAEEQQQYDAFDAEVDTFTNRIQTEERQEERECEFSGSANGGRNPGRDHQPGGETRKQQNAREYRSQLISYLAGGAIEDQLLTDAPERRAALGVNIGVPTAGGVLAPTELEKIVLDFVSENNVMRGLCSVRQSASNVDIPCTTGRTTAYHLDEGADFTKSTAAWNKVTMGAHKIGALSVVTHEALEDVLIDLEGWIRDDFGRAFARLEEEDLTMGDGVKKPRGFTIDAAVGVKAASATAIAADELIDLQEALPARNRQNAVFLLSRSALKAVRKLKTQDGQYLWQPGLQIGQPGVLLGSRVLVNEFMDDLGAGKKPVAYGDFSQYRILDRSGFYFQRLSELYAASGQVGFLGYKRYDGRLLDINAVQMLQMKTA